MSRHRDIRNMDYSEDYDGYDDIYGHSVDDDYCISPSNRQFMYNRDRLDSLKFCEDDIKEVKEFDELSDVDKAKVESCLDQIKSTLPDVNIPNSEQISLVLKHKFNMELIINAILEDPKCQKKLDHEKDEHNIIQSIPPTTVKVVTSTKTTTNVIKGFELPSKDQEDDLKKGNGTQVNLTRDKCLEVPVTDNMSQSTSTSGKEPQSLLVVDVDEKATRKGLKADILAQFQKERDNGKAYLYMVVIGHVDAGKSTLMGRLLCDLGQVNKKTMHKYEQESKKLGKQSFMYAWVLDETCEERNRGITMDVGKYQFETKRKTVILLDAPGHKDFIPNMISGAGQADVALLVVDATRGEFETGFEQGGQTREHALIVRSLGVTQLVVAVNKLDNVSWSKERFDEIVKKLKNFLRQAGFKENDVTYVPCSGLTGQNLVKAPTENELLQWYNGPCLIEVIDNFNASERPILKPMRFSISDIFKGTGSGFCVSGRVETGTINIGDKLLICPNRELVTAKNLQMDELSKTIVFAGDQATITLSGIEIPNLTVGSILCDAARPIPVACKFEARIVVFNIQIPITKGFSIVLHHQSLVEPAVISKLISQLNRSTGEVQKKHPRFLENNTSAIVEITVSRLIALECYTDCKELGRVMLRIGGVTIAAGLVTKIIL